MKIVVIGGGSFGTAFANQLASNPNNFVTLFVRNRNQQQEINQFNTNKRYFPNKKLNSRLKATTDLKLLKTAQLLFLALPSKAIVEFLLSAKIYLSKDVLVVNLSKGIFDNGTTIVEFLKTELVTTNVVTMKGPTFSTELINNAHSIFTLGFKSKLQYLQIKKTIENTNLHIDYTTDIKGVELLSVLKNIYAILLGVIDAKYNSPNTRFMILTRAFYEIRILLKEFGGREDTLFLSCGYGDIGMTSLHDLSRNRTLGLLIGKGFYKHEINSNNVVFEGLDTLKLINSRLPIHTKKRLPLFSKLENYFSNKTKTFDIYFDSLVDRKMKTVVTYGTFDLLHYGHLEILRRARGLGDRLIVGLSTDKFNKLKNKDSQISYEKRKEFLEALDFVDFVIPENDWSQKPHDIQTNEVDVFVMGDDWKGEFDFLEKYCEVLYLPRTIGISTTKLKSVIKEG